MRVDMLFFPRMLLFSYVGPIRFLPAINSHLTADNFCSIVHAYFLPSGEALFGSPSLYAGYYSLRHQCRENCWQNWVLVRTFFLSVFNSLVLAAQCFAQLAIFVAVPVFLAVGSGLLFPLNTTASEAKLISFQILAGLGVGLRMQNSVLASSYCVFEKLNSEIN
jgi:hypothetical protein